MLIFAFTSFYLFDYFFFLASLDWRMSCENEAIGPGENLSYTLPSQTVSHKLGKSAISRQQSTTAVSHGKSWKPPVAPKPSLLKSCRTETIPMTVTPDPGHQQSVNNESCQRSEKRYSQWTTVWTSNAATKTSYAFPQGTSLSSTSPICPNLTSFSSWAAS